MKMGKSKSSILAFGLLLMLLFSMAAEAKIEVIRFDQLSEMQKINEIKKEIEELEPYVVSWVPEWRFKISKRTVIRRITDCYKKADKYSEEFPDNYELVLLKGLVAHYAYQLDLKEYYYYACNLLEDAARLNPKDYRPAWFLGVHLSKAMQAEAGMEKMLSVLQTEDPDRLPFSFWEDFTTCASLAFMPSHVVYGAQYAGKCQDKGSMLMIDLLEHEAMEVLKEPPVNGMVDWKNIWTAHEAAVTRLINRMFGYSMVVPDKWKISPGNYMFGTMKLTLSLPVSKGYKGSVVSFITITTQLLNNDRTIDDYLKEQLDSRYSFTESVYPMQFGAAKLYTGNNPSTAAVEGGSCRLIAVFSRQAPQWPGLLMEYPLRPKRNNAKSGMNFYTLKEQYTRFPGEILYMITLDTPQSLLEESKKAFEELLDDMIVE